MKKSMRVLAAMVLALSMMAMPAMADEGKTLAELEQELADAHLLVESLEGEVLELEGLIEKKEGEILAQEGVIAGLKADLLVAQQELADAEADRDSASVTLIAFGGTYKDGECNNRTGAKAACEAALAVYNGTVTAVSDADAAVGAIEEAIEEAEDVLSDLKTDLENLNTDLGLTEQQLTDAKEAVIEAQAALDAYEAATVHPGCTGINNAKANVARNVPVKSNANAALAAVGVKLGC